MKIIEKTLLPCKKDFIGNFEEELSFLKDILKNEEELIGIHTELQVSVRNSFVIAGQIGLSLNPLLKLCYLEKKDGLYFLCPTYTGLISIMMDTGELFDIYAEVVGSSDDFKIEYGTNKSLFHKKSNNTGDIIGAYACYYTKDMVKRFEYLPIEEILNIRDWSDSYKDDVLNNTKLSAWNNNFKHEMYKKTAIKRLWKYMPKTKKMLNIAKAIDLDNQINGINFDIIKQKEKIRTLNERSDIALQQALQKLLKK